MVESSVINFAQRIPSRSHIGAFYNTSYDKWRLLSAFIKGNLEKKQSVIYFSNGPDSQIVSKLHEAGIDIARIQKNGGFSISDGERWYLQQKSVKEGRISGAWKEAVHNTLSRGFKGLCVICEPANFLGPDLSRVLSYEKSLPRRFSFPLSVICKYSAEDLLSFEDGNFLVKLADAHSHVVTPCFVGAAGFSNDYGQSLIRSLEGMLGRTITSVFFSFVKAKRRSWKDDPSGLVAGIDRYLNEFFGKDASKVIKKRILEEQYERIGLKFKSLI